MIADPPLIGRDGALATLREVVARARDFSAPQLVSIIGNRGTGKTRLVRELIAELGARTGDSAPTRVFHGGAAIHADGKPPPLSAIGALLRDRFGQPPAPEPADRDRLTRELRTVLAGDHSAEMMHLLGGVVGVDYAPTPFLRAVGDAPDHKAQLVRSAVRRLVEIDAGAGALVLALDDVHRADDETLVLLDELARGLPGSPVVLIVAARPELLVRSGAWGQSADDHTRIDLRNLEPDDSEKMLRALLAPVAGLADHIVQDAALLTGGNPGFTMQLVRQFLANGTLDASAPAWKLDEARAAKAELPIEVADAIETRIAALERDERDLLEKAAVFGNVFWLSAVVALSRLETAEPEDLLAPLDLEWGQGEAIRRRISDLIFVLAEQDYVLPLDPADSSIPGDTEIVFKHNLERELVIKSMPPAKVARYSLAAAQWLEARVSQRSDEQLEFLAGLYEHGGQSQHAARCYFQGGDRARARYAPDEARALYERGLAMIGTADAPARLDALHNRGDVLEQAGKTAEAMGCFSDMLALAWQLDNFGKAGAAYIRLARARRRFGDYDVALDLLRRARELFERSEDERGIASALDETGRVLALRGSYAQALDLHREALALRRAQGDRRSIALSTANIGRVHHDTGNFDAALVQFREALDLRRDAGDLIGVVQSLCDLGSVHAETGNHDAALELFEEARQMAGDIGDRLALADVLSRASEVKSAIGRGDEAVRDVSEAQVIARGMGDRGALASAHLRLAQIQLRLGHLDAADDEAREAVAVSEAVGLRVQVGCGYRARAEVAAARGELAEAEANFRRAVDVLATVKHELELARTYDGLALVVARGGKSAEAAELRGQAADIFARLRGAAMLE